MVFAECWSCFALAAAERASAVVVEQRREQKMVVGVVELAGQPAPPCNERGIMTVSESGDNAYGEPATRLSAQMLGLYAASQSTKSLDADGTDKKRFFSYR